MPPVIPPVRASAGVHLAQVHIAFGIGCDAVDVRELAEPMPAVPSEEADDFHLLAIHDLNLLIGTVGHVEEARLLVPRKSHAETRAEAGRRLALNEDFLQKSSIQ